MEEPVSFGAEGLRLEKEKVLSAVRVPDDLARCTARGQYAAGWQGGEEVLGYLQEQGVAEDSRTETYAAVRLDLDTRRWAGVPFYLRTGKRLGKRVTEIAVVFKRAPHLPLRAHRHRGAGAERRRHPRPARRGGHAAFRCQGARGADGGP